MKRYYSYIFFIVLFSAFSIPFLVSSVTIGPPTKFTSIFDIFDAVRKFAYFFLAPIAIIVILLGAFNFLSAAGDPSKVAKARQILFYGAIGIAVVIFAAAIPTILMNIMGVEKPIALNGTPVTTETCSQLGGACCPSDKACSNRILNASDCIDCCPSINNCQEIDQPTDWPHDPQAALSKLASDPVLTAQAGSEVKSLFDTKSAIDSLFGF